MRGSRRLACLLSLTTAVCTGSFSESATCLCRRRKRSPPKSLSIEFGNRNYLPIDMLSKIMVSPKWPCAFRVRHLTRPDGRSFYEGTFFRE
jgi:hypothetical protein